MRHPSAPPCAPLPVSVDVAVDRKAVLVQPGREWLVGCDLADLADEVGAGDVFLVVLAGQRKLDRRGVVERARARRSAEREERGRDETERETSHPVERTGV